MQPAATRQNGVVEIPVQRIHRDAVQTQHDRLAVEEPLEIRLEYGTPSDRRRKNIAITMRTPGCDADLALGYLYSEGIIRSSEQVVRVEHVGSDCPRQEKQNVITVALHSQVQFDAVRLERNFYTTSSCGVCGKTSIEALAMNGCSPLPPAFPMLDAAVVHGLPDTLRAVQQVFAQTGGLHAAALFDATGHLLMVREDVGRHNAVDKLVGACLQSGLLPLSDHVLLVSGRASFELVQKALMAGIPVLAAVGAPSSLAVELAASYNMTLLGFVREIRFNVYAGPERLCVQPHASAQTRSVRGGVLPAGQAG